MGFKAKHLLNRTNNLSVTVAFEEDGQVKEGQLAVKHRVLTPALWAKIRADKGPSAKETADDQSAAAKDSLVAELLELLVDWDAEGDDGKVIPINAETLGEVDYKILKEIDGAIYRNAFPNVTT